MEIKFIDRKTGEMVVENPPAEGLLKFLYDNPFGKTAILPLAKRKIVSSYVGKRMYRKSSTKKIKNFVSKMNIDMSESVKSISEFSSFNDFFYRKLKPSARPIGEGFVSPGDGKLLAFESPSEVHNFFVKGRKFTLAEFLNSEVLAEKHKNDALNALNDGLFKK